MQGKGKRLIQELKTLVIDVMKTIPECGTTASGCPYSEIQDSAGLDLNLPAQDGWLTWSVLSALAIDHRVESLKKGRRLYWRLV